MWLSYACSQFQLFRFAMESDCCYLNLYWHHISWNERLFVWQALDYIWRNCLRKQEFSVCLSLSLVPVDRSEVWPAEGGGAEVLDWGCNGHANRRKLPDGIEGWCHTVRVSLSMIETIMRISVWLGTQNIGAKHWLSVCLALNNDSQPTCNLLSCLL